MTIVAARSEMGCGSRTSVPLVLADELDADWAKVKLQQATATRSTATRTPTARTRSAVSSTQMRVTRRHGARHAGYSRRATVEGAVDGMFYRAESRWCTSLRGQKLTYGQLAAAAAKLPVPPKESVTLKKRSEWRYIGKDTALYDLPDIVTGKAMFGMDAKMPGMVYASIEHPPVLGQKVVSYDDKAALQVKGVKQVVTLDPYKPPHAFSRWAAWR